MQRCLRKDVIIDGVGLHSGRATRLRVRPAPADHGIYFQRVDTSDAEPVKAFYANVTNTELCTRLGEGASQVSTVEHVMAALVACGIHNALLEVDGPELPIMDGSAAPFVRAFWEAGIQEQQRPIRAIKMRKTVEVRHHDASAVLKPARLPELQFEIAFHASAIGYQAKGLEISNGAVMRELCDSRTFCNAHEVDQMKARGLALGGGFHNAVVIDGATVLNPEGLRHDDECVRHKMLDAIGDLALAGAPIIGCYIGRKAGHRLTNMLLHALFEDESQFEYVICDQENVDILPGMGLKPSDLGMVASGAAV